MALFDLIFDESRLSSLSQVELADMCSVLWDAYFRSDKDNQIALKYNKAASQYNANAGSTMLTAITPSTVNTLETTEDDLKPREKIVNTKPVKATRVVKEPTLKIYGEFKQSTAPMQLTPELQTIIDKLKEGASGATVIREAYFLMQETGFNVADFEKYSGINKGRIVGCLKKLSNGGE